MVRLKQHEIDSLVERVKAQFGENAQVWIYGSRADDQAHGGDIDLYIETDLEQGLVEAKVELRVALDPVFGEQKIDLSVRCRSIPPTAFQELAKGSGVELTGSH